MDYRIRGLPENGSRKLFMDHKIASIQDYIDTDTLLRYDAVDINVYQGNMFIPNAHQRNRAEELLFNIDEYELPPKVRLEISDNLRREMIEIFSGAMLLKEWRWKKL
jgi:S-adenosylmethionine decarboxylase